jgi:two-component system, sporulation sensor kinase E
MEQSTFVHNASHELRTPLGVILGYAELMYDGRLGVLDPDQERALSIIINNVHELRRIVERLGILMSVEAKAMAPAPLSLVEVTIQVAEEKQVEARQAGIDLSLRIEADLPLVSGDPVHLRQAVESLVDNALKFTPGGGKIEIEVKREFEWVCVTVTDTGIGIAEHELEQIFSGFYQVDGSITRRYGGLGLGLTLVKAVAEEHGGQVKVESQPGKGSRFCVKLPAREMSADWLDELKQWRHSPMLEAERAPAGTHCPNLWRNGERCLLFPTLKGMDFAMLTRRQSDWQQGQERLN